MFLVAVAELRRLGRSPAIFWLRAAYAGWLLLAIADAGREHPFGPRSAAEASRIGAAFADKVLIAQFLAAIVFAPLVMAGALAGERQRGTLEPLLVTPLSASSVVMGKYLARLIALSSLLLTGLPVLGVVALAGGVDPISVFVGTGTALAFAAGLAGLTIGFSAAELTPAEAGVWGVFWFAQLGLIASFLTRMSWMPASPFGWFISWVPYCLVAAVVGPLAGSLFLRGRSTRKPPPKDDRELLIRETWGRLARAPEPDAPLRPPVSDRPLLWKELYAAGRGLPEVQQALSVIEMVAVSFGAALAALVLVADWGGGAHASGPIAVMGSVLLGLRTAGIGLAAAQSISRERQRGTLDLLLVMPCDRREILAAKWHGALGALWPATVALAGFVGLCLLAGMLPLGGALLLGIAAIVHAALAANVGLCVSIGCRTTVSAGMTGLVALAGVAFGPWLAWRALALLGLPIYRPELTSLIDAGLTPPLTWYYLLSSAPWNWLLPVVVPGLAMQALAAAGLWLLARRWFERQEV